MDAGIDCILNIAHALLFSANTRADIRFISVTTHKLIFIWQLTGIVTVLHSMDIDIMDINDFGDISYISDIGYVRDIAEIC